MTFPKHSKTLHNVWSSVPLKAIRFKIMRNIGHAFFKMHQFPDAIDSYENLLMHGAQHLDFMTGFNLILCYFALGDKATWPAKQNRWKRAMIWNWHLCCSVCSIIQWQQADSSRVFADIVSSVLTDPSIYSEIGCSNLEISCSKLRTFGPSAIGWLIGPHFQDIGKQSERIWGQDEKRLLKAAEHRAGGLGGFRRRRRNRAGPNWRAEPGLDGVKVMILMCILWLIFPTKCPLKTGKTVPGWDEMFKLGAQRYLCTQTWVVWMLHGLWLLRWFLVSHFPKLPLSSSPSRQEAGKCQPHPDGGRWRLAGGHQAKTAWSSQVDGRIGNSLENLDGAAYSHHLFICILKCG